MYRVLIFLIPFTLFCLSANGQLFDNFSDGDLNNNPSWLGQPENFIVNTDGQLQLMAPEGGTSYLYSSYNGFDSLEWNFDFIMEFSPSASNQLKVYFAIDQSNPSMANGYYLDIGENGSEDAIHVYRLDAGVETLIASATLGAIATDPAQANVQLIRNEDGLWTLNTDYNLNGVLLNELEFMDDTYDLAGTLYFGMFCTYTSTRVDKFFFDNINLKELKPDTTPPSVISATLIDPNTIEVLFSELITEDDILDLNVYSVNNGVGNPTNIFQDAQNPALVTIEFDQDLPGGVDNILSISPVSDLSGNLSETSTFTLFIFESAGPGDIIVNEILFDPYSGGADFVEIYNNSNKLIEISDLVIANLAKDESDDILTELILEPGEYLAFTDDRQHILDNYQIQDASRIIENPIPSFNNEDGNVSIQSVVNGSLMTLDSFDYEEDFHYILLDDTEGVSLERLRFDTETNDQNNWHSAASVIGYSTPGYLNSNFLGNAIIESQFQFENKVFSPDNDGTDDLLIINYELEELGNITNIKIFDAKGRLERDLYRNELLSTNGFVKWDGTNELGEIAPMGVYIVWIEIFNPNGDVSHCTKACVLAERFNE